MTKIVSIHSFRRGTGKTNLVASLGAVMAVAGKRVGLIDTDFQSPSLHILFGIDDEQIPYFLNDYVHQSSEIDDVSIDLTEHLDATFPGHMFLTPANPSPSAITRTLREGFDIERLSAGYHRLAKILDLDALLIDTHAGISGQSMASLAVSDVALIVFRLDQQDYQGTGVLIELVQKLTVDDVVLVINDVASTYDPQKIKEETQGTYGVEVAALIPHSADLMTLGSSGVFSLLYPDHPLTDLFRQLASRLTV